MFGNNGYGGFGTFAYPNQTDNFSRAYGQTPYNNSMIGQQQIQFNPQPVGNFYYINGIEGAKAFVVQANSTAILIDNDEKDVIYIKSANQQGQATITPYKVVQITEKNTPKNENNINIDNLPTKEDIKALNEKYEILADKVESQNREFVEFTNRFKPVNKEVNKNV